MTHTPTPRYRMSADVVQQALYNLGDHYDPTSAEQNVEDARKVLVALNDAGYVLMRNLNTHPGPSLCSFCGCVVSPEGVCPWCDDEPDASAPYRNSGDPS